MADIKKYERFFVEIIRKICLRIKLIQMDDWWRFTGADSWTLFPPSFYYTHTEEEIKRITDEVFDRTQKMIDKIDEEILKRD